MLSLTFTLRHALELPNRRGLAATRRLALMASKAKRAMFEVKPLPTPQAQPQAKKQPADLPTRAAEAVARLGTLSATATADNLPKIEGMVKPLVEELAAAGLTEDAARVTAAINEIRNKVNGQ